MQLAHHCTDAATLIPAGFPMQHPQPAVQRCHFQAVQQPAASLAAAPAQPTMEVKQEAE